jgi:hypothetical protein
MPRREATARQAVAGYSNAPLAKKLGIVGGSCVLAINRPDDYRELLDPVPDGVDFTTRLSSRVTVIHLFVTWRKDLLERVKSLRTRMGSNASLWISWPKRASGVPSDITEDTIRDVALPLGLVDVKVCAVTEVWSGLKLVIRKEHRGL